MIRTDANTKAGEEHLGWRLFDTHLEEQYINQSYNRITQKAETFSWQLRLDTFLKARGAYDGLALFKHSELKDLEAKYRKALLAMEKDMDALVDSTVDDLARQSQEQLESTEKDGYLDKVKKRKLVLMGVTAALYALELSFALATIDPFSKAAATCQHITAVNGVLSRELSGAAMRNAIMSLPGTSGWNMFHYQSYWYTNWYDFFWELPRHYVDHLKNLQGQLAGDVFVNIIIPSLALIGLVAAMAHTWKTMGLISNIKMDIAKEVLDAIEPSPETQNKWQNKVANTDTAVTTTQAPVMGTSSSSSQEGYSGFADQSKGLEERLLLLGTELRRELEVGLAV